MTPSKSVKDYIRTIVDFPHEGIMFRDVTTLFADPRGFRMAIDQLLHPYAGVRFDKVVGLEARGFILGGAIAHHVKNRPHFDDPFDDSFDDLADHFDDNDEGCARHAHGNGHAAEEERGDEDTTTVCSSPSCSSLSTHLVEEGCRAPPSVPASCRPS